MFRRIGTAEVELGMFIQQLEGSWFKHPFWRKKFVLIDPRQLRDLQCSDIDGVIIDTEKGRDVVVEASEVPLERPVPRVLRPARFQQHSLGPVRTLPSAPAQPTAPFAPAVRREFGKALRVVGRTEMAVSRVFLESRLGKAVNVKRVEPVVEEVFQSLQENPHAFGGLMRCRDGVPTVYRHAMAVSALMISLAMRMKLAPREIRLAGMAGLMMDIGLGHLPESIQCPDGPLTTDARQDPHHIVLGYDILRAAEGLPEEIMQVCLNHHERMDGSGYPAGLGAASIDRFSRMAGICDSFDNLISFDGNGEALDPARALQVLADAQAQYDTDILAAFIESVGTYPVGSVVELRSGHLAMVVNGDPDGTDLPIVRTFYDLLSQRRVQGETVNLRHCYGQDRIVGIGNLSGLELDNMEALREAVMAEALKA